MEEPVSRLCCCWCGSLPVAADRHLVSNFIFPNVAAFTFFFALLILNAKVKNLSSTYCIRMIITMSRNNVSYRMGLCLVLRRCTVFLLMVN